MLEELLKYLGYDVATIKTIDDFKKAFDPEFIRKSVAKEDKDIIAAVVGKRIGSLASKVKTIATKNGIDITKGEVEKKDVEDVIEFVFEGMAKTNLETVNTLKAEAAKTNDDKVKELQGLLDKTKSDYVQLDDLHKKTTTEFNQFKDQSTGQLKGFKTKKLLEDKYSKVKFKQDASELELEGFQVRIDKGYKFELNETETDLVPLGADGKKIPSTKVTGAFKTVEEILEEEAAKAKLLSQLPGEKKPIPPTIKTPGSLEEQPKTLPLNSRTAVE